MLVASVASGMAYIWRGYGGDLGFGGTVLDGYDSLLLWMLTSLAPIGLFTAFLFVPMVVLLERFGIRAFLPFVGAGAAAGAIPVALVAGSALSADSLLIFVLPGAVAGLTWWWLAIVRQPPNAANY